MFGSKLLTPAATQIGDRNAGKGISKKVWTGHSEEGKNDLILIVWEVLGATPLTK